MPPIQDTITTSDDPESFRIPFVFVISREWLEVIVFSAFLLGSVIGVVTRRLRRRPPKFEDSEKGVENEKAGKAGMQVMDSGTDGAEPSMKSADVADFTKNDQPAPPPHSSGDCRTPSCVGEPTPTSPSPPVAHAVDPPTLTSLPDNQPSIPQQLTPDDAKRMRARDHESQSRKRVKDAEEKLRNTLIMITQKDDGRAIPTRKHQFLDTAADILLADEAELKKLRHQIQMLRKANGVLVVENAGLERRCQVLYAGGLQDSEKEKISNTVHQGNTALLSKYDESIISQNIQKNVPTTTCKRQPNLPEPACDDSEAETKKLQERIQALRAPDPEISLRLQDEKAQTTSSTSQLEESTPEKEAHVDSTKFGTDIKRGVQRQKRYPGDSSICFGTSAGTFREQPLNPDPRPVPAVLRDASHEPNPAFRSIARNYRSVSVSSPVLPSLNTTNIHKDIAARGPRTNTVVIGPVKSVQALLPVIPELIDMSLADISCCDNKQFFSLRFEGGPGHAERFVKRWDSRGLVECPDAILWYVPDRWSTI